jgi:hypothetical protein
MEVKMGVKIETKSFVLILIKKIFTNISENLQERICLFWETPETRPGFSLKI